MRFTSRERCLRAIRREDVDSQPLNIWVDSPEPLKSLMDYLGIDDIEKLLRHFEIDFRGFLPNFSGLGIGLQGGFREEAFKDDSGRALHRSVLGVVSAYSLDGLTNMYVEYPLAHMEASEYPWPEVKREDFDNVLKERRKHEDYCLVGGALQAFETACSLFGYNRIFRFMLSEPKEVKYALDKLFNITYEQAKLLAEAGVDQVYSGDDVGTQTTMMLSPTLWRDFLKPKYRKLAEIVHHGGSYFHFHSDGWIEPIIQDLVEVGVDVLEPLQPEAMDPVKVKRMYGDKLSFEGAISVQRTLPFGGIREVKKEVEFSLKNLGPTGYAMRPSHTILRGTPIRNILELYKAAKKFRKVK